MIGNLKIIIISKMVVTIGTTVGGNFEILPAAALMIEGHGDE